MDLLAHLAGPVLKSQSMLCRASDTIDFENLLVRFQHVFVCFVFPWGGGRPIFINDCLKVSCLMLVVWFGLIRVVLLRFACLVVVLVFVVPRVHVCCDLRVYCWCGGVFV